MKTNLEAYIANIKHLPAAPIVLVKLISLFRQSDQDVDAVVQLLSQDPSLTAEVLKRCNSASVSGAEPVLDIFDAIMRLGFYEVYQTTVTLFGAKTMEMSKTGNVIAVDQLWDHSLTTALASGRLAKDLGESEGIAYTAGLLHDIGKIVLATADGPRYSEILRRVGTTGGALEDAETITFGFGHGAIGAQLLSNWGVPLDVSMPVFCHHRPKEAESFERLSAIVSLGNLMAHSCADQPDKNAAPDLAPALPAAEFLQIGNDQLVVLLENVRTEIAGRERLFA
ncbi:MAG TPA: HDOD domain-containing protein [Verrucomicrobiae bacterium]|jgi:putative nucleotidyltransferase with HDIG domain|nr:HDOD domain-containing protein [Verrucomicrobiae bacterium]